VKVWMPRTSGAAFERALRDALGPGIEPAFGETRPDPAAYRVLVAGTPRAEDLDASPVLDTLIVPWAGLPESTAALLRERPHLAVHNLHHNAPAVAETAVGLLLAAARGLLPADQALRRGDWRVRYDPEAGLRLVSRTALVLGYGAVGRRVARALGALDMEVHALRRTAGEAVESGMHVHAISRLDDLLPRAEVLVLALPLTDETRGLLDARRIARLPADALLVNVARAEIVDEDALYEALASGRLGGAGLDVWYRYPHGEEARATTLPAHRPFHELENVVLSPHRAGHGRGTEAARARDLAALLRAVENGGPVPHRVDLARGY